MPSFSPLLLALAAFLVTTIEGAGAQTAAKPERGMETTTPKAATEKSERAMPAPTKDTETPPASAERAMPAPEKK